MTTNGVNLEAQRYTQLQDRRGWWQPGGPGPGQRKFYFDQDIGAFFITASSMPSGVGSIEPIFIPDPRRPGRYQIIGRSRGEPELPTATVEAHERRLGLPRLLLAKNCPNNFYVLGGNCSDPSDFYNGWSGYVDILSRYQYEGNIDRGGLYTRTGDDPVTNSLTLKGVSNYQKAALSFGEEAATDVVVEVIDVVFGQNITCAECGLPNDGSQVAYALTRANVGSPSAPGQVLYTVNQGATWATNSITGIGVSAEPLFLDVAGGSLFVGTNGTSLFYSALNKNTAAPGTWSTVTLAAAVTDTWVQNASSIFFSAAGGSIYRTSNIAVAPTLIANGGGANLARIHGIGETVVAVGAAGAVYYSLNSGTTWALAAVPLAASLTAVRAISAQEWWVGTATGRVFYTINQGATWTESLFPGSGAGVVEDILFATRDIMYISHTLSSTARLIISLDGGNTYARDESTQHIQSWPTFARAGRLAAPSSEDLIAANYLLVAGLAASGTDGLLLFGAPTLV